MVHALRKQGQENFYKLEARLVCIVSESQDIQGIE